MSLTRVGSFIVKTEISAYDDYIYMQGVLRTKKEKISVKVHKKCKYIKYDFQPSYFNVPVMKHWKDRILEYTMYMYMIFAYGQNEKIKEKCIGTNSMNSLVSWFFMK